ncbi:DNA mismatch repair protein [Malassezia vespertilionis]|uniref:Mlh3p n=1 Tax=Malassezia vespertilionis TaxID=2020962 RepID=A0A2N1JCX0_9BASI|nr:DNA mismatch repair protein [Malassezia vespertilionis]PKI84377.1 Mlh3p [Malassezia vespertilionis]WFD06258.1 DNA mismatch repair protein [Malassezia vespertilionis]
MRYLPQATAARIRAALRMPSISSLVYELCTNAIAAGATDVEIHVDLDTWTLACTDRGATFTARPPFETQHTLGMLPWLGMLDIRAGAPTQFTFIQQDARTLCHDEAPSSSLARQSTTCVRVRDVFSRLPVRRNMLRTRAAKQRELARIRTQLCTLALFHPSTNVALYHGSICAVRIPHAPSIPARLCRMARPRPKHVHSVCTLQRYASWEVTMRAWVGAHGEATTALQYIAVNGTPIPRERGAAAMYALRHAHLADALPWQDGATYASICAGDGSLHRHVASMLHTLVQPRSAAHTHALFAVDLFITAAPWSAREAPRSWYMLLEELVCAAMDEAPKMPRTLPRTLPSTVRSAYFAPHPSRAAVHADLYPLARVEPGEAFAHTALRRAHVLAQVDAKYIVCTCRTGDASWLLFVDQHAADERVRLEQEIAAYVTACVRAQTEAHAAHIQALASPLHLAPDPSMLPRDTLAFWGFGIEYTPTGCIVHRIPHILARAYKREPLLVHAVLTAFTHQSEGEVREWSQWLRTAAHAPGGSSIVSAMRYLPRVFVHLIETHVCHTSIRFNQALSKQQCSMLLAQLADTSFPFLCAHGRPSIICIATTSVPRRRPVDWGRVE